MREELIKLHKEYCQFLDDNWERGDIGATRVEDLKNSFDCFMRWAEYGPLAFFGKN